VSGPDGPDYLYEQASAATEAYFGRRLEGVRASALGLVREQIAGCVAQIRLADATGRTQASEQPFSAPQRASGWYFGVYVPLPRHADGRARAVFIATDISWRRAAEQALAASEARFRSLADAAPGVVFEGSTDGNLFVNRYYQDYTGVPAAALLGDGWRAVIRAEDLDAALLPPSQAAAEGCPYPVECELRVRRHDGAWRWFLFRSVSIRAHEAPRMRWWGIGFDIDDRRQAEAHLRDSEARFRALADSAPVLIWESDAAGRLTWVNLPWLTLTGRTLEQELGDGWMACVHPEDLPGCLRIFHAALATRRRYRMDYRLRRADGTWRVMDESGAPRHGADGSFLGFIGSCVDVTDARAALAAQRMGEETLRLAVEATELGLWDLNLRTQDLHWSDRCKAMFGISPDMPVSMQDFHDGLHPGDRGRISAAFAAAIDPEMRGDYDVEYRTIGREDGIERWVAAKGRAFFDEQGRGIRAIGTTLDITARKRAEAELRRATEALEARVADRTAQLAESEARFRAYFEAVEDCVCTFAVMPDGRFLHEGFNPHGARRTGYDNAIARGRPPAGFMAPEIAQAVEAACASARDHGTHRATRRLAFPAGEGAFDMLMVPVRDAAGRVVRILGSLREVTEQVRLEEELRQTQKMQAIGQLTGGVAHDFNNLLTGIGGSLEMMAREVTTERGRRLLEAARRSTDRGAKLTGQLLAFARRQRLEPQPLDLNALVEGMAGLLRSTLGGAVEVQTRLAAGLPCALADATQVELAILNIAINARDAMPEGGTIVVSTAEVEAGPPQSGEDPPAGRHVVVTVHDSGHGMAPDVRARIFEPFFTTKDVGRGSGLGLPQVLGVAQQLGGGVRVHSGPGAGTTVELHLPRAEAPPEGTVPAAARAAPADGLRGAAVLLVDDDDAVRDVTASLLRELGCTVRTAVSGAAALDLLAGGVRADAVLMDYAMPGLNGRETAARLLALRPGLSVVLMTGYADFAALAQDGLPVLRKPFTAADLARILAASLDRVASVPLA
jgi:PAS domain S-box-containing protein